VTTAEIDDYVEAAAAAAHVGGLVLREHARNLEALTVSEKASNDYVTAADHASEKAIAGYLNDRFRDHSLIAEESEELERGGPYTWIVDPLDGTTNFIHGFPVYAVSVSLRHEGRIIAGAVYDPVRDEMFLAGAGRGAFLGKDPIHVARREGLGGCLLATGFPFRRHDRLKEYLRSFEMFLRSSSGIRRAGSAALDLAYVACGRFDGFWEMALSPWDIAAGSLIVREAGGAASDFLGRDSYMKSGNILAGNPRVHSAMLEVLRRTLV
jgi:myo-inositol-1(or 4)-monophosphatase